MRIPRRISGDRPDAASDDATPRDGADVTRHRVRVGVTGLAVVFLLTVLAAALFSLLGQDDRGTTRLANGTVVANAAMTAEAPREPLAELGVAPGNVPPGNVIPAAPRPRRAATAPVTSDQAPPPRK